MRTNPNKYKYWVVFTHHTPGKKNYQDLSWEKLIDVVSAKKPDQIEAVKFSHPDAPFGTEHVDGMTMLELWKKVERREDSRRQQA